MVRDGIGIVVQRPWEEAVVGVEKDDVPAGRSFDTRVACCRDTAVELRDHLDAGGIARQDLLRVVRRAVVDDDHFVVLMVLREHGIEGAREPRGGVEARDHDAESGHTKAYAGTHPGCAHARPRHPDDVIGSGRRIASRRRVPPRSARALGPARRADL